MRAFVEDMHRHGGIHEDRWVEEKAIECLEKDLEALFRLRRTQNDIF